MNVGINLRWDLVFVDTLPSSESLVLAIEEGSILSHDRRTEYDTLLVETRLKEDRVERVRRDEEVYSPGKSLSVRRFNALDAAAALLTQRYVVSEQCKS